MCQYGLSSSSARQTSHGSQRSRYLSVIHTVRFQPVLHPVLVPFRCIWPCVTGWQYHLTSSNLALSLSREYLHFTGVFHAVIAAAGEVPLQLALAFRMPEVTMAGLRLTVQACFRRRTARSATQPGVAIALSPIIGHRSPLARVDLPLAADARRIIPGNGLETTEAWLALSAPREASPRVSREVASRFN